jgi:hypothetical protein
MAKPALATTFVQFVAIALLSLMIGGTVAACKQRDTDADDTARAKVFADAVARLEADRKALNEALLLVSHSEPLVGKGTPAKDPSLPFAATAKLLLEKGANIEVRDKYYGATPLLLAARYGETAVVKLLLEKGAKIEARDPYGGTALMAAACECPIIDSPDTSGSVRLLLETGADIEAKDNQGFTALLIAA